MYLQYAGPTANPHAALDERNSATPDTKKKSNKQAAAIDSNITLTVSSVSTLVNDSSPFVSFEQRLLPIIAIIVFLKVIIAVWSLPAVYLPNSHLSTAILHRLLRYL